MKFLDPLLVDDSALDRYLTRLAENTAQVLSRLGACEKRSELLREELEQVKSTLIQADKKVDDHEKRLDGIQKQLDSGKDKLDSSRCGSLAGTGKKVPIEGDFHNDCLKWKAKVGDSIKKGQVVAVCCMSKNIVIEYGSIRAPSDGVLLDKFFADGASLYGKNIVVGYIRAR